MSRVQRLKSVSLVLAVNLLAVVLGGFLATEWFIARKARTTLVYAPNPYYRQDLAPNQTYRRDGFTYRVGPHGLRGDPPKTPKPQGLLRIAVMGGSSVFDFRVGTSWPERLQAKLRIGRVEVVNAGIPGFSSREVVPFFERKIAAYSPDVVVLYAGWNDVKYMKAFRRAVELRPYPTRAPGATDPYAWLTAPRPIRNWLALPVLWSKVRLRAGLVAENSGAGPLVAPRAAKTTTAAPPAWGSSAGVEYWKDNLRRFVRVTRAAGAAPVLVAEATLYDSSTSAEDRARIAYEYVKLSHEELVEVTEVMARASREVAEELAVPWIDPRPQVTGRSEYFHDHVHLSEAGSEALAEALAEALTRELRVGE